MGRRKGEGGYIRIQNKSSVTVEIKVLEGRNVDEQGMDKIVGKIAPGEQLPVDGTERERNGTSIQYQYIEGDVKNRFQKDGYFQVQAQPIINDSEEDGGPPSQVTLVVDRNSWQAKDHTPDTESTVLLVADVDEEDDTGDWTLELRVFDNYNPKQWMEEYGDKHNLGAKSLCHVGLPGTHDSGTYKFDKDKGASSDSGLTKVSDILDHGRVLGKLNDMILDRIFERLCRCQDKSIQEQLEFGIRYVDLRVAYHADSESFMTCHGVYCVNMMEILTEINDFLSAHPKEILVMEFKKLFDMEAEQHTALITMICDVLGDKVANRNVCTQESTVQEFWDNGFQAVVLYENKEAADASEGKIWPLRSIYSPWPNAGDTTELYGKLNEKVQGNNGKRLFVIQGILTPDADLIQKELWDGNGDMSIKTIAKSCGGKVVDWVEEEWKPQNSINIVIVDFFENCGLLPAVINYNRS